MKTVKNSVFAIGVALSVAPIFNSASAQSSSESSAILLELQTLRTEIAELRDMVERQQFELGKVRRELAKRSAAAANQLADSSALPNSLPAGVQALPEQTQDGFNPYLQNGTVAAGGTQTGPTVDGTVPVNAGVLNPQDPYSPQNSPQGEISARQYADQAAAQSTAANATTYNSPSSSIPQQDGATAVPPVNANAADQTMSSKWVQSGGASNTSNGPVLSIPPADVNSNNSNTGINAAQTPSQSGAQSASTASVTGQTPQTATSQPQLTEDQFYDRGFDFLKQSKYDEAVNVFTQQIATYPQGSLADDAHYWIAEAMFIDRKPADARPHLRAIIDNYPQSPRLPDAMLKTAYIEQEMGNVIEARILLQEVIAKHPSSNAAIAAKNRLQNLTPSN